MTAYSYHARLSAKTRVLNQARRLFQRPPLEGWLRGRTAGRSTRSPWARLVPPEYTYPANSWREIVSGEVSLRLDLSNVTDHDAFFGFRDETLVRLHALIRPEHTVVDIGGNIGVRALEFARHAHEGLVVSFEPDPDTFRRLEEHATRNPDRRVTVRNIGIGATAQVLPLYRVEPGNSGMNRLLPDGPAASVHPSVEVRILPLAEALDGTGATKVDVIKIDVEGYEMGVLEGSLPIIRRDRPVLFIEVDDDNLRMQGASAGSLVGLLESLDYHVIDARDARALSSTDEYAGCHFDVLCTPRA
jgi:FkbM family methyltransferase